MEIGQHLADLVIQLLTFDEQGSHPAPLGQCPIPGQKHTIMGKGQAGQLMVIQGRIKDRIIAKDTQPFGQCAKHSIGDK